MPTCLKEDKPVWHDMFLLFPWLDTKSKKQNMSQTSTNNDSPLPTTNDSNLENDHDTSFPPSNPKSPMSTSSLPTIDKSSSANRLRRPKDSAFTQQRLPGWHPILTPYNVLPTLIILSLIFIPLGGIILASSVSLQEYWLDYTDCLNRAPNGSFAEIPGDSSIKWRNAGDGVCEMAFSVTKDIEGPVYLYYRLTNYFQNNRMYAKSVDWGQLKGKAQGRRELSTCAPLVGPSSEDNSVVYYPCGLIANSMFSDVIGDLKRSDQVEYKFSDKGIAWPSDLAKYNTTTYTLDQIRPPPYWTNHSNYVDQATGTYKSIPELNQDERFMVWMRTASFPTFRKLYGIHSGSLPAGDYTLSIKSTFDVRSFSGTKTIIIANGSWIGGKNLALGIAYAIVGGLFFLLGIGFLVRHFVKPRRLGDTRYLSWASQEDYCRCNS